MEEGAGARAWAVCAALIDAGERAFTPLARALTLAPARFAAADGAVAALAVRVGLSAEKAVMVKFVAVLLMAYPAAALVRALRPAWARHAAAAALGALLAQWLYGAHWFNLLLATLVATAVMWAGRRVADAADASDAAAGAAGGDGRGGGRGGCGARVLATAARRFHVAVLALLMLHLSAAHAWRMRADYLGWGIWFVGPLMVVTIKLSSLAFCLADGAPRQRAADAARLAKAAPGSREARVLAARALRAVERTPSLLQVLSYVFHPATFFAGPALEYSAHVAALEGLADEAESRGRTGTEARGGRTGDVGATASVPPPPQPLSSAAPSSPLLRALLLCAQSLVFLGLTLFAMVAGLGTEAMLAYAAPAPGAGAGARLAAPLAHAAKCWAILFFVRCKYYFAWLAAEGAGELAGFGGSGGGAAAGGASNVDIAAYELAPSVSVAIKAWNIATQTWLRRYVYERVAAPGGGGHARAALSVYLLSALWHGFYPGYYVAFLAMPLLQALETELAAALAASAAAAALPPLARRAGAALLVSLAISYQMVAFQQLSLERTWKAWRLLGFAGHLIPLALGAVLLVRRRFSAGKDGKAKSG